MLQLVLYGNLLHGRFFHFWCYDRQQTPVFTSFIQTSVDCGQFILHSDDVSGLIRTSRRGMICALRTLEGCCLSRLWKPVEAGQVDTLQVLSSRETDCVTD